MKVKAFFIVITIFLTSFNLHAYEGAKNWLNEKGKNLIEAFGETNIDKKHKKLDAILLEDIDMEYVSKFVMGKHYKNMSEEQKKRYKKAFRQYALYAYKKFPLSFGENISFDVVDAYKENNIIKAKTKIFVSENNIFVVEFYLKPYEDGYKIIDLRFEETSLILAYRNRFNEMMAEVDYEIDWFIEDLERAEKS